MRTPPDDPLRSLRDSAALVMTVHPRDRVWTHPQRVMHAVTQIIEDAPPGAREAVTMLLSGAGDARIPRKLVAATCNHIAEFDEMYALSRTSGMFAFPHMSRLVDRWLPLQQELLKSGIDPKAVEQMDRYLMVRFNALVGVEQRLPLQALPMLATSSRRVRRTARSLFEEVEEYAEASLRRQGRTLKELKNMPFQDLDAFGKLLRLLPAEDPAWRQLAALAEDRAARGVLLPANHMQGLLGEIVAARTPGVLAFFQQETQKILGRHPELLQQGWRVVYQPNSVMMAKRAKAFEQGGQLAEEGVQASGLSFDLSVWLVNEQTDQAMVVVRAQVKAGTEETVMSGTKQVKADDWRMFSGSVTLDLNGQAKNFDLRPPDVFTEIKVLVGADLPPAERLAEAVTPASVLDVFRLPLTGQEFGMLGGILARVGTRQ
jgi:hypothetical protein